MDIYLPIAGQSVNALLMIVLGFVVGLLSGMFGVGGGFLTTPLLIFYGIPPTVAVASATTQITGASVSGVMVHIRRGGVDLKMGGGDDRRRRLRVGRRRGSVPAASVERPDRCRDRPPLRADPRLDRRADAEGCAGRARLSSKRPRRTQPPRHNRWVASLPLRWRFYSSGLYISPVAPLALGFVAGILTVLLGIGGGFILVPAMIYLLGMPARVVIGTSLIDDPAVSAATTMVHALTTRAVDIVLAGAAAGRRGHRRPVRRAPDAHDEARFSAACTRRHHPARRPAHVPRPVLAARRNLLDRISVRLRLASLLLALLGAAAGRRGQARSRPDISARQVQIRYSFTGAQLLLFGADRLSRRPRAGAAGGHRRRASRARSSRSCSARSRRSPGSG